MEDRGERGGGEVVEGTWCVVRMVVMVRPRAAAAAMSTSGFTGSTAAHTRAAVSTTAHAQVTRGQATKSPDSFPHPLTQISEIIIQDTNGDHVHSASAAATVQA